MNFNITPINKLLTKSNEDYDIELLWYGLKNLFITFFKKLEINGENINTCVKKISDKLNKYQEDKEFLNIYIEIYSFIIIFLENYIEQIKNTNFTAELYNYELIETWLTRYNRIDYIKKIGLPDTYKESRDILKMEKDNKVYYKFMIIKYIIENKLNGELLDLFDKNLLGYLDNLVLLNNNKLFDSLSTKYNLQEFYKYKNINKRYVPIKLIKFKKINIPC